jgi:hypothetical protein
VNRTRHSGIICHPTSFPGPHGIGDLGEPAFRFVEWLARGAQTEWQILPLGPVGPGGLAICFAVRICRKRPPDLAALVGGRRLAGQPVRGGPTAVLRRQRAF